MSYDKIKSLAKTLGIYRSARWVNRHFLNRKELLAYRRELRFYSGLVSPGSLCFDVGANYGTKTEVFLQCGATVVAFEPQQDCLAELKARLGANPRLIPVNAAVGSVKGRLTLYIGEHRSTSSLQKDWQKDAVGTCEVGVTTLDEAIAQFGAPQYCKIDVEGHEPEVLKGLNRAIPLVSFEYHLWGDGPARAIDCLDRLSQFGAILVNVTPAEKPEFAREEWWSQSDFMEFFHRELLRMAGYNYGDIFVRIQDHEPSGEPDRTGD